MKCRISFFFLTLPALCRTSGCPRSTRSTEPFCESVQRTWWEVVLSLAGKHRFRQQSHLDGVSSISPSLASQSKCCSRLLKRLAAVNGFQLLPQLSNEGLHVLTRDSGGVGWHPFVHTDSMNWHTPSVWLWMARLERTRARKGGLQRNPAVTDPGQSW